MIMNIFGVFAIGVRRAGVPVEDQSFANLDARIAGDSDTEQRWAEEADLCDRLLAITD
jgi:hypothetical protein